mgnify:FL=1
MKFLFSLVVVFAVTAQAIAEDAIQAPKFGYDQPGKFARGKYEFTAGAAAYFGPFVATHNRPTHNYAIGLFNIGYMLNDVNEWGFARGNFEGIGELFAGAPFKGSGNYLAGGTLWLRYNFVQPDWDIVPYAQIGAGAGAMDFSQYYYGQIFQFNLGAAFGFRYFIRPDLAVNLEYRYQHMSNANTGPKNLGVNSQGVMLGISWFH